MIIKITLNVDEHAKLLAIWATESGVELDVGKSVVDLMKALRLDSSLGTRKALARRCGYSGPLKGSAEMNTFVRRRVMKQYIQAGGNLPEALRRAIEEVEDALHTRPVSPSRESACWLEPGDNSYASIQAGGYYPKL